MSPGSPPQAQAAAAGTSPVPSVSPVSQGLNHLSVHSVALPGRRRAVLEAPAYRALPRPRVDLLRYRRIAYDRLCGDTIPSLVPAGYAGAVEDGSPTLLSEQASGLPLAHGKRGWVVAHHQDDGHVTVSSLTDVSSSPVPWGTSTRSLLGLRDNPSQDSRLWRLGGHVVWLRQDHPPAPTSRLWGRDDGAWPAALVAELFDAALCTVMLGTRPLPGIPSGAVVLLESGQALVLGLARTPGELSSFLSDDHVHHYLVTPTPEGASPPLSVGDLPRGSVAHRSLGERAAVVFTERLEQATTSYRAEDGDVLAVVEDRVDYYTGVPGLSGAWVEVSQPHVLRWPGGSWSDGGDVLDLQEETAEVVQVMTDRRQSYQRVSLALGATVPETEGSPPEPAQAPVLWCPRVEDPVAGRDGTVTARSAAGHVVEVVLTEAGRSAVPLVWFDDAVELPQAPSGPRRCDLGSLAPGAAAWCHGATRPVVRVGIDYYRLSLLEPEDVLAQLRQAWDAAVAVVAEVVADAPGDTAPPQGQPFLGGYSFGAALAAVCVLRGACAPTGALLRNGAYNRYATPHGFEHDCRTAASAPGLYRLMSLLPRASTHQGAPFLITCSGSDENSATTPQQSVDLHENLLAAGADTTLAVFPDEGHAFSSRRAVLERRRLEEEWMRAHTPCNQQQPAERTPHL